jgi:hypothetical protein
VASGLCGFEFPPPASHLAGYGGLCRQGVVRDVAGDLVAAVEEDDFGCEVPAGAAVVEHEAVDTDEQVDRLEVERGIGLKSCGEVRAQRVLAGDREFHAAYHVSANRRARWWSSVIFFLHSLVSAERMFTGS